MNDWKPLTFSAKSSILDILLGPENASGFTVFNPIQDGGGGGQAKKAPYQFFPCNFYKCRNWPL